MRIDLIAPRVRVCRRRFDDLAAVEVPVRVQKRGFLGWLRGERGHCSMARVPTIAEEDAKRPNRERDCLVGERTRIVNRVKSTLARLGIRNFKPTLRKGSERLATVHTPEGMPLPPNTLACLLPDTAFFSRSVAAAKSSAAAPGIATRGPPTAWRAVWGS